MCNRRTFLKQGSMLAMLESFHHGAIGSAPATASPNEAADHDYQGWKPTWIKQADGKGGWVLRPAQNSVSKLRSRRNAVF